MDTVVVEYKSIERHALTYSVQVYMAVTTKKRFEEMCCSIVYM